MPKRDKKNPDDFERNIIKNNKQMSICFKLGKMSMIRSVGELLDKDYNRGDIEKEIMEVYHKLQDQVDESLS